MIRGSDADALADHRAHGELPVLLDHILVDVVMRIAREGALAAERNGFGLVRLRCGERLVEHAADRGLIGDEVNRHSRLPRSRRGSARATRLDRNVRSGAARPCRSWAFPTPPMSTHRRWRRTTPRTTASCPRTSDS